MIVDQKTKFHWQAVFTSALDADSALKTSTLFLFLTAQVPNIQPSNLFKIDLNEYKNIDVLGTCLLKSNHNLVAFLKRLCLEILHGKTPPIGWDQILTQTTNTNAAVIFSYIKIVSWTNRNQYYLNVFIAKGRSAEYDAEVFAARLKESVSK